MKLKEFYEVNGCNWFIPVDLIEENKCTKELEVVATESGRITFVPNIYKFLKPPEPQKVVVPKFVAEWIVEAKKIHNNLSWVWFSNPVSDELNAWLKNHTETFMRAWLDGYEIEQEKLYIVEIPNPHTYIDNHSRLARNYKGKVVLEVQDWLNVAESYKLTESEIKEDFEWAWDAGFVKEVER